MQRDRLRRASRICHRTFLFGELLPLRSKQIEPEVMSMKACCLQALRTVRLQLTRQPRQPHATSVGIYRPAAGISESPRQIAACIWPRTWPSEPRELIGVPILRAGKPGTRPNATSAAGRPIIGALRYPAHVTFTLGQVCTAALLWAGLFQPWCQSWRLPRLPGLCVACGLGCIML